MTCVHTWLAILRSALEPPSDAAANTPVKIAPTMPPIACTPNTSSESSYLSARLSLVEARKHSTPAARPMISAPTGPTKPEAGVMATRPATAPEAMPSTLGLPWLSHSLSIQARAAAAAEPALKPNQPTQSIEAPITVSTRLCGGMAVVGQPLRLPRTSAATRPAIPALMCTTVPPAKSSTPQSHMSPPSPLHTMWAMGAYTTSDQMAVNHNSAENFIRSAKAPTISAGVMMGGGGGGGGGAGAGGGAGGGASGAPEGGA